VYQKSYHIHFVGIGGIGMSGIAELLLNLGYRVSGSDAVASDITENLKRLGGTIHVGHRPEHIEGADVVVMSSAIGKDNPELVAARQASIPIIPRAEMLAELMRLKFSVAVAGAHGKTSTTSLVAAVLAAGGFDPTVVIGGRLRSIGKNAVLGQGDFIVAEADESDGSFLKYAPTIAVVTNIDREHLDFYRDMAHIQESFLQFIDRVPFYGLTVVCLDNEAIQDILPRIHKRLMTYGTNPQADFTARKIVFEGMRTRFQVDFRGKPVGEFLLNLPGRHNVTNATAAIAVGMELGVGYEVLKDALRQVQGVQRRLEIKGEASGVTVVDDYGHHPTEIRTTLDTLRSCFPDRRAVVVFQPHRFTRTRALFDEFSRSFYLSDVLFVLPIYPAGEQPIEGVHSLDLVQSIQHHGHRNVRYVDQHAEAVNALRDVVREGDVVLTLGAGDVWKVGELLLAALR